MSGAATAGSGIDFELSPVVSGFWKQWVFVDAGVLIPCSCFQWRQLLLAPTGVMQGSLTHG